MEQFLVEGLRFLKARCLPISSCSLILLTESKQQMSNQLDLSPFTLSVPLCCRFPLMPARIVRFHLQISTPTHTIERAGKCKEQQQKKLLMPFDSWQL